MINFIIMDDEEKHNRNMESRLECIFKKHSIEAVVKLSATDPSQVINYCMENRMDNVYLLDVDFGSSINGIDLAHKIREYDMQSYIVFVSAHPEYVMSSLKTKIFDFLVKPISIETLERCILTIYKDYTDLNKEKRHNLVVKSGLNVYQIDPEDIIFFEKYGHLLIIHTQNGQIRCKESLENIMHKLDENFTKCHKSYLVNIGYIARIDNQDNIIYFKNGESCLLSKRCKKELNIICSAL